MRNIEEVRQAVGEKFLVRQAGENFAIELKGNPSAQDISEAKSFLEGLAKENGLRAGSTQKMVTTFWLNQPSISTSSAAAELAAMKAELEAMKALVAATAASTKVATQTRRASQTQAPF
jgi:hypothetical protein